MIQKQKCYKDMGIILQSLRTEPAENSRRFGKKGNQNTSKVEQELLAIIDISLECLSGNYSFQRMKTRIKRIVEKW